MEAAVEVKVDGYTSEMSEKEKRGLSISVAKLQESELETAEKRELEDGDRARDWRGNCGRC